jgi:hypothetical protein
MDQCLDNQGQVHCLTLCNEEWLCIDYLESGAGWRRYPLQDGRRQQRTASSGPGKLTNVLVLLYGTENGYNRQG